MQRKPLNTTLALVAAIPLLTTVAAASEIYRYVEEDGTVRYVDRPTGQTDPERVAIVSRPTDNAAVQERYDAEFGDKESGGDADQAGDENVEQEDKPMTRAERRAEAAERAKKCEQYKDQLERVVSHRRLYREGENGEHIYLNDEEVQESRDKARQLVEETCN